MNSTANMVRRHLLGYSCNLYTDFEDQFNTLKVLEIWNDLRNADSTKSTDSLTFIHERAGNEATNLQVNFHSLNRHPQSLEDFV